MLVIVMNGKDKLYRTCYRDNLKKVAKSIHAEFPESDYPSLEGVIFNGLAKNLRELTLQSPNGKADNL